MQRAANHGKGGKVKHKERASREGRSKKSSVVDPDLVRLEIFGRIRIWIRIRKILFQIRSALDAQFQNLIFQNKFP
jgi:hypothetical protein